MASQIWEKTELYEFPDAGRERPPTSQSVRSVSPSSVWLATYSASGALGNFSGAGPTGTVDANLTNPPIEYLLGGDEIDLFMAESEQPDPLPLQPPAFGSDYIYNCSSSACVGDFSDGGVYIGPGAFVGHGPGELTSTLVPEPTSVSLLLIGLLTVSGLAIVRKLRCV